VHLGQTERARYQTAVCEDGSSYLVNSNGRVVALDPNGGIVADRRRAELEGTRAAVCAEGALLTFVGRRDLGPNLAYKYVASGAGSLVARVPEVPVVSAVADADAGVFVVSPGAEGDLALLTTGGALVRRFGSAGKDSRVDLRALFASRVLWDRARQRLLHIHGSPLTVAEYTREGQLLARRALPIAREGSTRERLLGAVVLPNGELLVQVELLYPVGAGVVRSDVPLFHLDQGLATLASPWRPAADGAGVAGYLEGADSSGSVYFQKVDRPGGSRGIHVVRARITPTGR
jgi:hypothetical protein